MTYHNNKQFMAPTIIAASVNLALASLAAGMPVLATAQKTAADPATMARVEITGSIVKRLNAEMSVPVEVITKADIEKAGVSTAEQLLGQVAASVGAIEEKQQNTDTQKNSGFSGADLRGLGVSSTLVLLNGRRMANYAFGGQGVDLSSIPMAALERVEILKDGASATYGADAVGGVINFITRKDYHGFDVGVRAGGYQQGGGNRKQVSVGAGFGELDKDSFNVFGSLQYQKSAQLPASQREWSKTALRPDVGSIGTSSTNWPANLFTTSSTASLLGSVNTNGGKCAPPQSVFSGGFCQFDYQATADLVPESTKLNSFMRGALKLGAEHRLFAEAAYSSNEAYYRISPASFTSYRMSASGPQIALFYPLKGPFFPKTYTSMSSGLAVNTPATKDIFVSVRLLPLGQRERVQATTQNRVVLGMEGKLAGRDYSVALNRSASDTTEQYNNGFVYGNKIGPLITSGVVNLWSDNTPEVMDQLRAIQANHVAGRSGNAVAQSISAHASSAVAKLPAGDLELALGFEVRRESLTDVQSAEAKSGLLNNVISSPDTRPSRQLKALFSELHVPVVPRFDLDLALRYDAYDSGDSGSSINPKLALRWQPLPQLVVRASAGKGFRAPSLADVSASGGVSSTSNFYTDPQRCIGAVGPGCKPNPFAIRSGGNPYLKLETSRQFSIGAAFAPGKELTASLDYWAIRKDHVISQLSESLIASNFAYISKHVTRDPADPAYPGLPGQIYEILLPVDNQGKRNVAGLDLAAVHRLRLDGYGRLKTSISAAWLTRSEEQLTAGGEFTENLDRYANLYPTPRWKHQLGAEWSAATWSAALTNRYQSGYRDAFASLVTPTGFVSSVAHGTPGSVSNRVKGYSNFDLMLSYNDWNNTSARIGVINLANKAPNTSNQAGYFRGFDQSVDATGRYGYVSMNYAYK